MAATQNDFKVLTNLVVRGTATIATVDSFVTTGTSAPLALPSLNLNFVASNSLDPRISFVRASGATYVGKNGLIQYAGLNQPRLDFDPVNTGTCLGLLIEEPRTNIHFYSAQAGQSVNNGYCRFTTASVVAPDGSLADIVTNTPSVNSYFYNQSSSIMTPLTYYTRSVYAKTYGGSNTIIFENYINAGNTNVQFNLATGAISNNSTGTAYMVNAGNGWYRCIWTFQSSASASDYSKVIYIGGYGTTPLTTPIAVWGSQFEAGAWPTSYIPTVASQVTRASETASVVGQAFNNFINQTQGTLFIDCTSIRKQPSIDYSQFLVLAGSNSNTDSIGIYAQTAGATQGYFAGSIRVNGGGTGFDTLCQAGATYSGKAALAYQVNDAKIYGNGYAQVPAGVPTALPITTSLLIFGQASYQPQPSGWIRRVMYYPTRLPDTQLQLLTTATVFTTTNFVNTVLATNARKPDFQVDNGVLTSANLEVADVDQLYATTLSRPTQQPSLMLNFLKGTLDSRITFSRASGASVIGPNGRIQYVGNNVPRFDYSTTSTATCLGLLIEESRTNIYTNSQNFTATVSWSVPSCPYQVNGITAPDGSQTGFLLTSIPNVTSSFGTGVYSHILNSTYTRSVYAKAISGVGKLWWQISPNQVNYYSPQYDLINGVVVSNNTGTATIVNAGDGWWRCIHTFNTTGVVPIGDSWFIGGYGSGPTTSTVALWGAQMEQGYFATSYIPTGNSSVTRAVELATMSGQNLYSWYNPTQGTIYIESDSITTATQTGVILDISDISDSSRISIYRQSDKQPVVQYYIPNPVSNVQIGLGAIWTDLSVRKLGTSYSANNFYIVSNAVNSSTITSGAVPGNISKFSIGSFTSGASPANGHIRRIVYYPEQLSSTQTVLLTVI